MHVAYLSRHKLTVRRIHLHLKWSANCFCRSIRTNRFDLESSSLSEEFVIVHPSEFHGRIHRNLSPWHKEVPSIEVFAKMGDVAVCVSPADVAAVKTLLDSATSELGGAQAAETEEGEEQAARIEEGGGLREEEVEEKATLEPEGEDDEAHYPPMWSLCCDYICTSLLCPLSEEHPPAPATSQYTSSVVVHADVRSASLTLQNEVTSITEIAVGGMCINSHTPSHLHPHTPSHLHLHTPSHLHPHPAHYTRMYHTVRRALPLSESVQCELTPPTSTSGLHTDVNLGPGRTTVTARWVKEDKVHLFVAPPSPTYAPIPQEVALLFPSSSITCTACRGLRWWTFSAIPDTRPSRLSLTQ